MTGETRGNIEVRLDDDGVLDEVVTHGPTQCHVERLDEGVFWMRWDQEGGDSLVVFMRAFKGKVTRNVIDKVATIDGEIITPRFEWD